jgi:hypothetical protein
MKQQDLMAGYVQVALFAKSAGFGKNHDEGAPMKLVEAISLHRCHRGNIRGYVVVFDMFMTIMTPESTTRR